MRNLFLSLRATILIAREQSARQKMYNRRIKIVDFCEKHKRHDYNMKELAEGQVRLFNREIK